ncbi:Maltose transport system permease protein [Clostridium bornimense]|uniref:Maltose transport system permease protein n=1 Tax=Clostridium bornimense TaxID=1216932 RepID=W6RXI2_9CLOT|nr:ABC transporter permease subunit [Clostridium bornimense]CDM69153.1 Maltose transport system permease protein [Clostridium bornimense]
MAETNLKYKKKLRSDQIRSAWFGRLFIWIMIVITMFPILAVIAASLSPGQAFTASIWPKNPTLENYKIVLQETDFLIWVKNSMIICISVALLQTTTSVLAAFAFARLKFTGRKSGLMALLILQMFPNTMALPAIIKIVFDLNLSNSMLVLILLVGAGSAYYIWLIKGTIDGIPMELSEAAYIDGATTFQMFRKIIFPLLRNMMIVIFLLSFIAAYSEFIFTSSILKDTELKTISTGLQQFITNNFSGKWTQYSAAAVMSSLPVVILFLCSQKYISKGLVSGAVKG